MPQKLSTISATILGLLCLTLAGCVTPERRLALSSCGAEAWHKYPAALQQQPFMNLRTVEVPNGNYSCSTTSLGRLKSTQCSPDTQTALQSYPDVRTVDLNSPGRRAYQAACANALCMRQFGNAECKPRQ